MGETRRFCPAPSSGTSAVCRRSSWPAACGRRCGAACGLRSACVRACADGPRRPARPRRRGWRPGCGASTIRRRAGPRITAPGAGAGAARRSAGGPGGAWMVAVLRERRSEHHRVAGRAAVPLLRCPPDVACPFAAVVPLVREQDRAARGHDRPAARCHPAAPEDGAGRGSSGVAGVAGRESWWRCFKSTPGMDAYVDVEAFERSARDPGLLTDRQPGTLAAAALAIWLGTAAGRTATRMTHRFSAYGLAVESNVACRGWPPIPAARPADVVVRLAESESAADRRRCQASGPGTSARSGTTGRAVADRLARRRLSLRLRRGGGVLRRPRRRHRRWRLAPAAHGLGCRQLRAGAGARVRASPARRRAASRRGGRRPRRRDVVHGPRGRRQVQHGRRHRRTGP